MSALLARLGTRHASWLLPALLAALLAIQTVTLLLQPGQLGDDDPIRWEVLRQIADGHWPTTKFSVVMLAIAAPFYMAARAVGHD